MSDKATGLDQDTMKLGLLMESAQAHQKLAETHLQHLKSHTQDLDAVVREEIRRTLVEELQSLTAETARAAEALRAMKRTANLRGVSWNLGVAVMCTALPVALAHWMLPTPELIASLRAQRDAIAQRIGQLEKQGGNIEWRRRGDAARLCVRIDKQAPSYGEHGEYYVVRGY